MKDLNTLILNLLGSRDDAVSYKEIANLANDNGFTKGQLAGKVRDLVKAEKIIRKGRGMYVLNSMDLFENFKHDVDNLLKKYNRSMSEFGKYDNDFMLMYNDLYQVRENYKDRG